MTFCLGASLRSGWRESQAPKEAGIATAPIWSQYEERTLYDRTTAALSFAPTGGSIGQCSWHRPPELTI
jgi:hypothetical protein